MTNQILCGDCFTLLPNVPDHCVDLVITDPPYQKTACKWDQPIDLTEMWVQLKRIGKPTAAYVFTTTQPFTTDLVSSNRDWYRYDWVWAKSNPSNIAQAKHQPMRYHEYVNMFYQHPPTYNPQMIPRKSPRIQQAQRARYTFHNSGSEQTGLGCVEVPATAYNANTKYPSSILEIPSLRPNAREFVRHPTQKPLALWRYLIRTYTNPDDLVLDPFAGSSTTAIACKELGRHWICMELSPAYCDIGQQRVAEVEKRLDM